MPVHYNVSIVYNHMVLSTCAVIKSNCKECIYIYTFLTKCSKITCLSGFEYTRNPWLNMGKERNLFHDVHCLNGTSFVTEKKQAPADSFKSTDTTRLLYPCYIFKMLNYFTSTRFKLFADSFHIKLMYHSNNL
jgi:hypothetical protein